jgi:hypothetical protein
MHTCSSILAVFSLVAATSLPLVACSSTHSVTIPATGDSDAGASDPGSGSTTGSSHDAGKPDTAPPPPACGGFGSSTAACDTCIKGTCCTAAATCGANADCTSLATCAGSCSTSACVTQCESTYPGGVDDLSAFLTCTSDRCNGACTTKKGIGDSCSTAAGCTSGDCAGAGWCTKGCTQNTDCRSSSTSLTNEYGKLDWCVQSTSGAQSCFPECSYNSDCTPYAGTHCQTTTAVNGATIGVCSF